MILRISHRLGLASIGGRFLGGERVQRLGGIEVQEFLEYQNPALIADARALMASSYAQTQTFVLNTKGRS